MQYSVAHTMVISKDTFQKLLNEKFIKDVVILNPNKKNG